jgi:hypothetical protein
MSPLKKINLSWPRKTAISSDPYLFIFAKNHVPTFSYTFLNQIQSAHRLALHSIKPNDCLSEQLAEILQVGLKIYFPIP